MDNNLNSYIVAKIRKEIDFCGCSQAELSRAIGVSKPTISQYLAGKIQPSLSTLSKMCSYLGCSADEILGLHDDKINQHLKMIRKQKNREKELQEKALEEASQENIDSEQKLNDESKPNLSDYKKPQLNRESKSKQSDEKKSHSKNKKSEK